MALNPSSCASAILDSYKDAASLVDDMTPDSDDDGVIQPPETNSFASDFATAYDDYAKGGVVPGALNTGGDASTIQSLLESFSSDTGLDIPAFSQAVADYWSGVAVDPGVAAHGGVAVTAVENDCGDKAGDIQAAIEAEITDQETTPYYENLITAIESVITSAVWTVTEQMSDGSSKDFPETIS